MFFIQNSYISSGQIKKMFVSMGGGTMFKVGGQIVEVENSVLAPVVMLCTMQGVSEGGCALPEAEAFLKMLSKMKQFGALFFIAFLSSSVSLSYQGPIWENRTW